MPHIPGFEETISKPALSIREFIEKNHTRLKIFPEPGDPDLEREISRKRLQKLGMALTGFTDYLQEGRIYVFGNTETRFFLKQSPPERIEILERLADTRLSCLLITQGLEPPAELVKFARSNQTVVLQTDLESSTAIHLFSEFLEEELSPRIAIHGVLIDIFGVGALLVGESGIGKSECALELVLKGHRMVADDTVEIRCIGENHLVGSAPEALRDVLELRGIGIVNMRDMFGISAIRRNKDVNFIIEMENWAPHKQYDRLGLEMNTLKILNFDVPFITIPVAPGRNLATLVELACRVYLMRYHGMNPMGEFARILSPEKSPAENSAEGESA